MFFWAETIWPAKPGNVLPGPLQENSAHPAPELCCSKRGLWTSSIGWPGIRTRNLVFTPDLLIQNLQIPGKSCSQYSLRSASLQALLYHPVVAPSPGADSQRGPGGVATWSPAPSRPSSQHLDPRTPAPSPSAGLRPGAHVPARQVVKIQLFI